MTISNSMRQMRMLTAIGCLLFVVGPASIGCDDQAARREAEANRAAEIAAAEAKLKVERMAFPDSTAMIRGMRNPKLISAADATLADDAPVLGIVVDGKARAYSIESLSRVVSHVMNDSFDGVPVTVTYCDRTECMRAFRGTGEEPLDFWLAGWKEGRLQLKLGDEIYFQEDESIPLPTIPCEQMTWKAWRTLHPDTELHP